MQVSEDVEEHDLDMINVILDQVAWATLALNLYFVLCLIFPKPLLLHRPSLRNSISAIAHLGKFLFVVVAVLVWIGILVRTPQLPRAFISPYQHIRCRVTQFLRCPCTSRVGLHLGSPFTQSCANFLGLLTRIMSLKMVSYALHRRPHLHATDRATHPMKWCLWMHILLVGGW